MKKRFLTGVGLVLMLFGCSIDGPCESMLTGLPPAMVWMEFRSKSSDENVFDNGTYTVDDIAVFNEDNQEMDLYYDRIHGGLKFYFSPYEFGKENNVSVRIKDEVDVRIKFFADIHNFECYTSHSIRDLSVINYEFEEDNHMASIIIKLD